jgi:DNA-binding transcriptional ArsR family regulator
VRPRAELDERPRSRPVRKATLSSRLTSAKTNPAISRRCTRLRLRLRRFREWANRCRLDPHDDLPWARAAVTPTPIAFITKCCHGKVSGNLRFVVTNRSFDGLTALGDPTRRAIFDCLAERPRAVGELAEALPVSRPAVSQHLKVLKDAGLVTDNASGTRRIYRLNPEGVAAMRDQLDTYWNRALEGYVWAVDQTRQEKQ